MVNKSRGCQLNIGPNILYANDGLCVHSGLPNESKGLKGRTRRRKIIAYTGKLL